MASWEDHLQRWEQAGVVDAPTAERVRAFEAQQEAPAGARWQVTIMLSLGIILLIGGMMLLVASHWDQVSPWQRLAMVMGFLCAFHLFAAFSGSRFPGLATTLHGVGTAGAGAAILTIGIIFNMQEHWPTAVLVWSICAAAGWWLLRDQVQQILTLLLVPTWLVCEWSFRAEGYEHAEVYTARMFAVLGAAMLTSFLRDRRKGVFWTLYAVGGLGLIVTTAQLTEGWERSWEHTPMVPLGMRLASLAIVLVFVVAAWLSARRNLLPMAAVVGMVYLLPWLVRPDHFQEGDAGVLSYTVVALTCAVFVWWGLQQRSRAVVNYAIATFALTVLSFYFSSLMDKLGRSLGLIGLGVVFLAGGWLLERLRRQLIAGMQKEGA